MNCTIGEFQVRTEVVSGDSAGPVEEGKHIKVEVDIPFEVGPS